MFYNDAILPVMLKEGGPCISAALPAEQRAPGQAERGIYFW